MKLFVEKFHRRSVQKCDVGGQDRCSMRKEKNGMYVCGKDSTPCRRRY